MGCRPEHMAGLYLAGLLAVLMNTATETAPCIHGVRGRLCADCHAEELQNEIERLKAERDQYAGILNLHINQIGRLKAELLNVTEALQAVIDGIKSQSTAYLWDRALSNNELQKLSDGTLDPKNV